MALRDMPTARRSRPAPSPPPAGPDRLPTLVAPRLQLRWIEPADLEDLYAVFSDPAPAEALIRFQKKSTATIKILLALLFLALAIFMFFGTGWLKG